MPGTRALAAAVLTALAALAGAPVAGAQPARPTASCRGALPVTIRLPTRTARALEHLGFARAVAGARVRDLHVMVKRDGRMVAQGSRARAFTGSAPVRLAFQRRARPGAVSLVATGRRPGCAKRRSIRRAISLDGNDLPLRLSPADLDVADGRFAVRVLRTGEGLVSDLRVRVLDARGTTIAEHVRAAPLGAPLRIEFAPTARPAAGRYGILVTADVGRERERGPLPRRSSLAPQRHRRAAPPTRRRAPPCSRSW